MASAAALLIADRSISAIRIGSSSLRTGTIRRAYPRNVQAQGVQQFFRLKLTVNHFDVLGHDPDGKKRRRREGPDKVRFVSEAEGFLPRRSSACAACMSSCAATISATKREMNIW
jgi:hypothetical protein